MDIQNLQNLIVHVTCTKCGKVVQRRNFARHWRRRHADSGEDPIGFAVPTLSIGQNQVVPALSYVGPARQCEAASEANSSFSASNPNPEKLIYVYERAAKAILKQHHRYTQEDLTEFLASEYPKVPESHRLALIHGATAAAQSVANLFVLWEGARTATDETSRATAEAAHRSLSFFNFGLMSRNFNDSRPQAPTTSAVTVSSTGSEAATTTLAAGGIPLLKLPLVCGEPARERKRQDPDIEPSTSSDEEEGDDLGASPPSIELVEGQPSSAQRPKNQEKHSRKKMRKESETEELEVIPPTAETYHSMSVDNRIDYMLQLPETGPQPMGIYELSGIRYAVTDSRGPSAHHAMPERAEREHRQRGVSPYVPLPYIPSSVRALQPSMHGGSGRPRYYPGTTIEISTAKSTTASAALGRPPSASPERKPSKESLHEPQKKGESHRREADDRHRERRGESTRRRTPSPRRRRTSTPVCPSKERDRAPTRHGRHDPSR